jgi:lysophospholipase L1-like esterase
MIEGSMAKGHKTTAKIVIGLAFGFGIVSLLILCAMVAGEWVIGCCLPVSNLGPVFESPPYKQLLILSGPKGVATPIHHTTNRWGMRGDEPPKDWQAWNTLITIGSSTTFGVCSDDKNTWPYQLQTEMQKGDVKTWVGNAGQDGVTSESGVLMMDKVIRKLRPKTVLFLAGGSDLVLCFSDKRREHGNPYDQAFARRVTKAELPLSFKNRWRLYQEYRLLKQKSKTQVLTLPEANHKNWFPSPLVGSEDSLPPDSVVLVSLPNFLINIRKMHLLAKEMGIRIVFLTQPLLYTESPEWSLFEARKIEIDKKVYRISAATERRWQNRYNSSLLSLCDSERMACLDLAKQIPADTAYFYDQAHFNDAGNRLAASRIADYLRGP